MAWIESHQTLARHPKVIRLASRLKINKAQAIGHLHLLWWWTLDYAPSGDVSAFASCELGVAAEWMGDADGFRRALEEVGWIDEDGTLHDWHDYAGRLLERRNKDAGRKRDMRKAYEDGTIDGIRKRDGDFCRYCGNEVDWTDRKTGGGGTYDHVNPGGESSIENMVVACRRCNSGKGSRTPEQAGMLLTPIKCASNASSDNRTQPTVPNPTKKAEAPSGAVVVPDGLIALDGFVTEWTAYIQSRRTLKKPLTEHAKELVLEQIAKRPHLAIRGLQICVERGWQGIKYGLDAAAEENPAKARAQREQMRPISQDPSGCREWLAEHYPGTPFKSFANWPRDVQREFEGTRK